MGKDSEPVIIRRVHVLVALLGLAASLVSGVLSIGAMYGTISSHMREHDEHLKQLDEHTVTKEQFDEMRSDIRDRLERIERKLDQDFADAPARKR